MKSLISIASAVLILTPCLLAQSGESQAPEPGSFEAASSELSQELEASMAELDALYKIIAEEKIPLNARVNDLEAELSKARAAFQSTTQLLDSRTLDLTNLRSELTSRKDESRYLKNLLSEYMRNFESRLHIAEEQRYGEALDQAGLALENTALADDEVFAALAGVLDLSLKRLDGALGGERFSGQALDAGGVLRSGTFLLLGPTGFFASEDGTVVGAAEQRLNSAEPAAVAWTDPLNAAAAAAVIETGAGLLPIDTTLGNAQKIETTEESLLDQIKRGGAVMYPILGMAGLALLVALFKWLTMSFQRMPSEKQVRGVLEAVGQDNPELAEQRAAHLRGPLGKMLTLGVKHMSDPRELIEEVMFEKLLTTRLKLNSYLPFISICAASAPLLGLLGTVTGIINTFKMITVFGSGDVKSLSGGISEALITTEFGLIVAIPSLLIHAFLSRKAKSRVDRMEKAALALVNQIGQARPDSLESADIDVRLVAEGAPVRAAAPSRDTYRLEGMIGQLLDEQARLAKRLEEGQSELASLRNDLEHQGA